LLAQLAAIVAPVFLLAGVGFVWRRLGLRFERDFVTRLIMSVAAPCLIVDTLAGLALPPGDFLLMVGAAAVLYTLNAAAAVTMLQLAGLPLRSFLPALTFGNNGNFGLPLALFAFGETGLGLAMAVFVLASTTHFTVAPVFQSRAPALTSLLTTPVIYAAVLGLVLLVADWSLPVALGRGVSMLGSIAIPLMLLTMGYSLAGLRLARLRRSLVLGALRLALGFGAALTTVELLGLEGLIRQVLLLQGAMPAAIFSYLLAARYQRHPEDVAGIVLVSTVISLVTVPLLIAWLLQ
jgi:predicted permease